MVEQIVDLKLPLSAEQARELKLGQMVTVSGLLFTGRSRFHIRTIENNIIPPLDYEKINCFFHVGPVMKQNAQGQWEIVSIEPTSSIRFERYSADVIRKLKLHVLIGKTTMGPATSQALAEVGGVHLTKIGICGNQLSAQVKKVHEVHFLEELGKTEATWVFAVEKLGPFFVDMDASGNNYFSNLNKQVVNNIEALSTRLGISKDYKFTNVDAE